MRTFLISIIIATSVYATGGQEPTQDHGPQAPPQLKLPAPPVEESKTEAPWWANTLVQIVGIIVGAAVTVGVGYMQHVGWTKKERKTKTAQRREAKVKKGYAKKEEEK